MLIEHTAAPTLPCACCHVTSAQDRDRRTMLFEERLEAAERRRLEGNALFAEAKYKEALAKYALVSHTCAWQGVHVEQQAAGA